MTAYEHKHNRANGEDNRDGSDDNRSWNHGLEGPGGEASIRTARRRSIRNLLATELFASGVPMITAGDELGRSQGGNNNTYCQDNDMSWIDWDLEPWQADLLATTRFLAGLRSSNPVLGQRSFFTGRRAHLDGVTDLQWFSADGQPMSNRTWDDGDNRTLTMLLDGTHVGGQSLLIILHGAAACPRGRSGHTEPLHSPCRRGTRHPHRGIGSGLQPGGVTTAVAMTGVAMYAAVTTDVLVRRWRP